MDGHETAQQIKAPGDEAGGIRSLLHMESTEMNYQNDYLNRQN